MVTNVFEFAQQTVSGGRKLAKVLQSIEDTLHLGADFLVYSDKKVGRKEAPQACRLTQSAFCVAQKAWQKGL